MALYTGTGKDPRDAHMGKATCYKCGKIGHKAYCCPTIQGQERAGSGSDGSGRFKGKCRIYGKKGHKEENCFEKQENAGKRTTGWKTCLKGDQEIADVAVSGGARRRGY